MPDFLLDKIHGDSEEEDCGGVTEKRTHTDDTGTLLMYYMYMYMYYTFRCRYYM